MNGHTLIRRTFLPWLALAAGMMAILLYEARHNEFTGWQWFWISSATIVVAGLSVWMVTIGLERASSAASADEETSQD